LWRVGTVLFAAAVLGALALWLGRVPDSSGDVKPLFPHDRMDMWQAATPPQKLETADRVLDAMVEEGTLGPQTQVALKNPAARQALARELADELDRAMSADRTEYVSPGQSIVMTAAQIAARQGWNK
jgi:hypothetical protein